MGACERHLDDLAPSQFAHIVEDAESGVDELHVLVHPFQEHHRVVAASAGFRAGFQGMLWFPRRDRYRPPAIARGTSHWPLGVEGVSFLDADRRSPRMRYVIQLLVPALVVIVVALVFLRNRGSMSQPPGEERSDDTPKVLSTGAFIAILVVAATFTAVLVYELQGYAH